MAGPSDVNRPGAAVCTGTCTELFAPATATLTFAVPTGVFQGIWKLIWVGERYRSGAGVPLTVTEIPLRLVGRALVRKPKAPVATPVPKFVPNRLANAPGEIGDVKLAPLRT